MKLFIDTANLEEIIEIEKWGILSGVTTNPSLIAKEKGAIFEDVIEEISKIVDGPISAEVTAEDVEGMVEEGKALAKIHENIVIKIPITPEGLKAIRRLSVEGIRTNCTLIFSLNQAILAIQAGANFISPFVGRLDDIGISGIELIKDIKKVIENSENCSNVEIIAASIRHPLHVQEVALAGAHIATIPYKVLQQMVKHPLTNVGIELFNRDFEGAKRSNG